MRATSLAELLDISGDVNRLDLTQDSDPLPFAPAQKLARGAAVGGARARVADIDGKKFEEAAGAALPCPSDQCRHPRGFDYQFR
jgi:hypothetical protein